jgi:UMF1 family MFS transporter
MKGIEKAGTTRHDVIDPDLPAATRPACPRERLAWALYDFANSGYTTVVLTTLFSAYFVGVVAGGPEGFPSGTATLLWTLAIGSANLCVLVTAPIVGAIADHRAAKKRFLFFTTVGCATATALLALVGPGDVALGMILVIISAIMFASGENLISAFLPEIVPVRRMGRMSGYGWSLGYLGGLMTLGFCLAYIAWAQRQGQTEHQFIPVTLLITAGVFALAATPTFVWLRERATPHPLARGVSSAIAPALPYYLPSMAVYVRAGIQRVRRSLTEAVRLPDLFRFLTALAVYQSGVATVVVLTAVYAREVMGFDSQALVRLIMVVNVTAAVGALLFGHLQDRLGSVRTLVISLLIWCGAIILVSVADDPVDIWLAGNLIGLAMGASQAVGRALIGQLTPVARTAEFFGLWGMANRLAAIAGPLSYGLISYWSGGNHRLAILSTLLFFIAGLVLLLRVNEQRGKAAALEYAPATSKVTTAMTPLE